jgi:copper chaperone NosL
MTANRLTAAIALAALLAGASACQRAELTGPPDLRLGRDQCIECGMIINEDRFSSAALVAVEERRGREHYLFDDVGCMLDYQREYPEIAFIELFAHDANTRAWLPAQEAVFLLTDPSAILTPMGSGIAAYADRAAAEAAQATFGGEILSYSELAAPRRAWIEARMEGWAGPDAGRQDGVR